MASTATDTRAPLGSFSDNSSVDKKRAAEEETTKPSSSNPYQDRMNQLQECRKSSPNKVIMYLADDILECIPGKLEELDIEEVQDLNEEQLTAAYSNVTQQQVEKYLQVMVVDRKLCENQQEYYNAIMFADDRNSPDDGMVCLNTYSSWCMYPVIQKLLTNATKEINKAKKAVEAAGHTTDTKSMASEAFNKAFATILAVDAMDHWRLDTESPEDCEKVAKKVGKVASDLLWFDDAELGFVDCYSRKAILTKLQSINDDWKNIGGIKFKNAKNAQGLGHSHAAPPPAKKFKQTTIAATSSSTSAGTNTTLGTNNDGLVDFLNAIPDKKKLREKTCVQVKIASVTKPEKSALVVLSGATDMKKMNQICAFVTGQSSNFEYHSQKGTCIKGSRIELELEGAKLWLAAKSMGKQAASNGVDHVEDKQVKIIQVFQGLNTSPTSGIVYDSNQARNVKAYWATPDGERYEITVQAIIANKCVDRGNSPMPRLVKHLDTHTPGARTGFGKGLYAANRTMQGNRKGPSYIMCAGSSQSHVNKTHDHCQSKPIANENGTVGGDFMLGSYWEPQNVATAGLPSPSSK